jgi:hypothetical protein
MMRLCPATNREIDTLESRYPDFSNIEVRVMAQLDGELEHVERAAKDPEFIAAHYGAGDFDADKAREAWAQPRKRIRIRSPKLYACDIEVGGEYVPKRGNDKTPNFVVTDIDRTEAEKYGDLVIYRDGKSDDICSANMDDFLALVARRVGA